MTVKIWMLALAAAAVIGCNGPVKRTAGLPTPPPTSPTPVKELAQLELKPDMDLQKQIDAIAADAEGSVGVATLCLETGDVATVNADSSFPMLSVYKLHIAMAVLREVDHDRLALDEIIGVTKQDMAPAGQRSPIREKYPDGTTLTIRELIGFSIMESDGTASDILLRLAGGPAAVQEYFWSIGIVDVAIENAGREFVGNWQVQYKNWTTPKAAVAVLRHLQEGTGVSPASREMLFKYLSDSPSGPRRLKGMLPSETIVAHKTGTSGSRDGITAATNDIGIIGLPGGRHLLIAVFVADSRSDERTRESVIARIARAAWDRYVDVPTPRTSSIRGKDNVANRAKSGYNVWTKGEII